MREKNHKGVQGGIFCASHFIIDTIHCRLFTVGGLCAYSDIKLSFLQYSSVFP